MKLLNKLFNRRRRKQDDGPENYAQNGQYLSGLPQQGDSIFEDYLFGDFLLPGIHAVVAEYTIDSKLTGLYAEMDKSLDKIFENGSIDEYNMNMFDNRIASARAHALRSVEHQYADTPQNIQIAVSKRQADKTRLEMGEAQIIKELGDLSTEMEALAERNAMQFRFTNKRRV